MFLLSPKESQVSRELPETVYASPQQSDKQQYLYTDNKRKSDADIYVDNIYNTLKRTSSKNKENLLNKRGEELLRIYDLYKRHSLTESLDLIKAKVESITAREDSDTHLHDSYNNNQLDSDVSIHTLKKAIELLKKSIKSHTGEEQNEQKPEVESNEQRTTTSETIHNTEAKKRREEATAHQQNPRSSKTNQGREEVAIPVYTQIEEKKEETGILYYLI